MAILNVTPDSFYAGSRLASLDDLTTAAKTALANGATMLDLGGCSTRPNSQPVDAETEWKRVEPALAVLRQSFPDATLSLDTFRPEIAQRAIEQFGQIIINDISGGCETMFSLVREKHVPYVWTLRGNYSLLDSIERMEGIDLILDPGFGFTGGVDQDYECMRRMDQLQAYQLPILVGVSRKSMLFRLLDLTPETSLSATQVLHLYALQHGATILRVHDVAEAMQTLTLYNKLYSNI